MRAGIKSQSPRLLEKPTVELLPGAPDLPTVFALANAARTAGLVISPDVKLLVVQHMLRTNLTLIQALISLGLRPENVSAVGKGYSTSPACVAALKGAGIHVSAELLPPAPGKYEETREQELASFLTKTGAQEWLRTEQKMIVCDVGGRLLSLVQNECTQVGAVGKTVGIELTTSGIRRLESATLCCPVINVAEAAAKSIHESPLVANTILGRLDRRMPGRWPRARAGVIGLGNIGRAMIEALRARGIEVLVSATHGENEALPQFNPIGIAELVESTDIVFGCSGFDVFRSGFPTRHRPNLILVSCSSEDIEFRSLLIQCERPPGISWPADDVTISGPSGPLTILLGGFPFNFDSSGISLPESMVQTTTALMLSAILTASHMLSRGLKDSPATFVQLPSFLQSAVLNHWRQSPAASEHLRHSLEAATGAEYLAAHSKGWPLPDQDIFARTALLMGSGPSGGPSLQPPGSEGESI